jgi:hypothetical protein
MLVPSGDVMVFVGGRGRLSTAVLTAARDGTAFAGANRETPHVV